MMKKLIVAAMLALPMMASAQSEWQTHKAQATETPKKVKKDSAPEVKENPDAPYLRGAVPEVDGKVVWSFRTEAPGLDAQQVYDRVLAYFDRLSKEDWQLEGSGVSLVNEQEHIVVASMREWLAFHTSLLSLDRTKLYFRIVVNCHDGWADVTADRISYRYEEERNPGAKPIKAEEWITDKVAISKKDKLYKGSAKFRRKTVDRMNELKEDLRNALRD